MPTTVRPFTPPRTSVRPRARLRAGGAVKRATYTVDARERVLFTLSADGVSRLIDAPAELYEAATSGLVTADTFIVEPNLEDGDSDELAAIVTDYLQQAGLHARVPMTFSRLRDFLEALAA
jgi:hypothetical protein